MADPYNELGYYSNAPVAPNQWSSLASDQRIGAIWRLGAVPPGFLLVENFLSARECDRMVAECDKAAKSPHAVAEHDAAPGSLKARLSAARTSQAIDPRTISFDLKAVIRRAFVEFAAPFFGKQIEWIEPPEILCYHAGGEYKPHADAEHWNAERREWTRVIDRDFSVLIYLNETFEGGEIDFPNFGMKFKPRRGLLIAFPSDHRYVHAARPVTHGVRYAIVSWAATRNSSRVSGQQKFAEILS